MGYNEPSDEHAGGLCYRQPRTMSERIAIANDMVEQLGVRGEIVCDSMQNAADTWFAACPDRLYVLSRGRVVYKGGRGPFFYDPDEMLAFLESTER